MEKIINDIIEDINVPYPIKLFIGEKKELNTLTNWINHLVFLIRPITFEPTFITGERKYIYNDLNLMFGKVHKFTGVVDLQLMKEALYNYELFIRAFRKIEYIKVTREQVIEIYNQYDMNLAGYSILLSFEQQIIKSQC